MNRERLSLADRAYAVVRFLLAELTRPRFTIPQALLILLLVVVVTGGLGSWLIDLFF